VVDAGYGNNTPFLKQLESRHLVYVAAIAKNRQVTVEMPGNQSPHKQGLEAVAQALPPEQFKPVQLNLDQPRIVWLALVQVQVPRLEGTRWVAIQLNAATWQEATEVDYFLTNAADENISATWIAQTYSQRNWVEVFYREAKGWFGLSEYQIRDAKSMKRHWILVFTAYTFVQGASVDWWIPQTLVNQTLTNLCRSIGGIPHRRRVPFCALAQSACRCIRFSPS